MEIEKSSMGAYREAFIMVMGDGKRHSEKVGPGQMRFKLRPK